jgi:hypothetical protein
MKKLLSLLMLTPVLALAQELPDEDWLCMPEQENILYIDKPVEKMRSETRFIFNPSIGLRRFGYDAVNINSAQCKSQNSGHSYFCETIDSELKLEIFYLNVEDSVFLATQTVEQFNGEETTVNARGMFTWMGECDKL